MARSCEQKSRKDALLAERVRCSGIEESRFENCDGDAVQIIVYVLFAENTVIKQLRFFIEICKVL